MKENTKRPQDLISNYCEEIHKLKRINLTAIRKEMSRMNGLSSEVIRKYDDEIGGNKPEWLLMGCMEKINAVMWSKRKMVQNERKPSTVQKM